MNLMTMPLCYLQPWLRPPPPMALSPLTMCWSPCGVASALCAARWGYFPFALQWPSLCICALNGRAWKALTSHMRCCLPALLQVLAAFLKAIGHIIPLMDAEHAFYYTREVGGLDRDRAGVALGSGWKRVLGPRETSLTCILLLVCPHLDHR